MTTSPTGTAYDLRECAASVVLPLQARSVVRYVGSLPLGTKINRGIAMMRAATTSVLMALVVVPVSFCRIAAQRRCALARNQPHA